MTDWQPDEAWLDQRFAKRVQPDLFRDRVAEGRPVAVLLGAQPGAGKSRATQFATALHAGRPVAINGDDFRSLHPDFKRLQRDDPEGMPVITQSVSGPLIARSIEYALEHRISVLVEGTFRTPEMVAETAQRFHSAGFRVHAIALAVPPEVSRASTLGRFYETLGTDQNRWTPPEAHEAAVRGLPRTADALARSAEVARFTILDRDGAVLEDSAEPGPARARAMVGHIEHVYSRELAPHERALVDGIRSQTTSAESATPQARLAILKARAAFGRPPTDATRGRRAAPRIEPRWPSRSARGRRGPEIEK